MKNKYSQFLTQKKAIRQDKKNSRDPSTQIKITELYDFLQSNILNVFVYRSKKGAFHGFKRRYDAVTIYTFEEVHKNFMFKGKAYGEYLRYGI